ncbi:uncharacterized protein LOC143239037 isoform X2 [Tachypleus tridentatus]|uniref:uncharacterized protein LOC143239037 isoform X2 n=1 Tax=Tachypleus tridentatus TaxID=6853 RepID=UPI003FD07BE2
MCSRRKGVSLFLTFNINIWFGLITYFKCNPNVLLLFYLTTQSLSLSQAEEEDLLSFTGCQSPKICSASFVRNTLPTERISKITWTCMDLTEKNFIVISVIKLSFGATMYMLIKEMFMIFQLVAVLQQILKEDCNFCVQCVIDSFRPTQI